MGYDYALVYDILVKQTKFDSRVLTKFPKTRNLHHSPGNPPFDNIRPTVYESGIVQNRLLDHHCGCVDNTMGQLPHTYGYLVISSECCARTDFVRYPG